MAYGDEVLSHTSEQDRASDTCSFNQVYVVLGYLVKTTLPWFGGSKVRVMDSPDVTIQAPQAEVAKGCATGVVDEYKWSRPFELTERTGL